MDASCHLLIDVGGHAARAAIVDATGHCHALRECRMATRRGEGGVVEHDAEAVLAAVGDAIDAAVSAAVAAGVVAPGKIVSAGLSCQRSSIVAWDRHDGRALSPVISWADSRAADLLASIAPDPDTVRGITGLRPTPFFGASKLAWLWHNVPTLRSVALAGRLGIAPLASYLLFHLLAGKPYRCSASIAQRTMLYDIAQGDWSPALCDAFGLDAALLPRPLPDIAEFGVLHVGEHEVPLRACAGDQNLVPIALGADDPQRIALNLGTGAFLFAPVTGGGTTAPALLASVLPSATTPPAQVQEGTVNGAGAAFDWLAQQYGVDTLPWSALDADRPDPPLFLNTIGGLGSPLWRAGSTPRFSTPPRDLEAAMGVVADSIAFLVQRNLDCLHGHGHDAGAITAGGGLSRSAGLCQRIADLAGLPVLRVADPELSLRGLARLLAGSEPASPCRDGFMPGPQAAQRRDRYAAWCLAMDEA